MSKPDPRILHTADQILKLLLENGIRISECNDVFYVAYKRMDKARAAINYTERDIYQKNANHEDKVFLTVKEAAEYLEVTTQTIYNKCKEDALPYIKVGNRYRIFQNRIFGSLVRHEERRQKVLFEK